MKYLPLPEAARRMGISHQRLRALCSQGKIPGAVRPSPTWMIPEDAVGNLPPRPLGRPRKKPPAGKRRSP